MIQSRSLHALRLLLPVACMALYGCSEPQDGQQPAAAVAPSAAPPVAAPPGSLDGTWEGTRTPDSGNPECGFASDIGFQVSGSVIQLRTHRLRRALGGTIDPYGRFAMTSTDGTRQVVGVIQHNQMTASETTPPIQRRRAIGEPVAGGICTASITAHRVASDPAGASAEQPAP